MRMRFFAVLVLLFFAGCVPADPLDWKIEAKTPNHYQTWRDSDFQRMPPAARQEFDRTFNWFATLSPGGARIKDVKDFDKENALCRRLHGRTVRNVILEGYQLESTSLLNKISTSLDNAMRLAERARQSADAATERELERVQAEHTAAIAKMNARLLEIKARVKEFERAPR